MALKKLVDLPLCFVNPKSYLYGKELLKLTMSADKTAEDLGIKIYFTCPFADIRMVKAHTKNLIVTAQSMESLKPGRGMGHLLPESLAEAGARAVFLNHAENPLTLSELYACINRAAELDMATIVCANSEAESRAVAELKPDIILAEPTELIGTGVPADPSYITNSVKAIKAVDPEIRVIIGSGITTAQDCYNAVHYGADGSSSTSGVVKAPDPGLRIREMAEATIKAYNER